MIITVGKTVKIETVWGITLTRSCETPGLVTVILKDGQHLKLPANNDEVEGFIAAYRRVVVEDIPYREVRVESPEKKGSTIG
jgi:hypothetical protein